MGKKYKLIYRPLTRKLNIMEEKIEKIGKVTRKGDVQSADETFNEENPIKSIEVNKEHFEALMMQEKKKPQVEAIDADSKSSKPTLMDEVANFSQKVESASRSNTKNIKVQAAELIAKLDDLKTKLSTPDLEIKSSVQTLLKNKLSHIDENLKIALNKAGIEYTPPVEQKNLSTPIERFLGYITSAQSQLEKLGTDIDSASVRKGNLSPGDMLQIQYKMGIVQQQVELFSNLLNQALQSMKTVMNVQI